jgi:hypothetical protein
MAKTRIVKKRTNTFDRFESHKHVRMGVRKIKRIKRIKKNKKK